MQLADSSIDRPVPVPDEVSEGFWEAVKEHGDLRIQQCDQCAAYYHPPVPQCFTCLTSGLAFVPVSGRGEVAGWTVMYEKLVAGFEGQVPYIGVLVALDEDPEVQLAANLIDADPTAVHVGMKVTAVFETIRDGWVLPQFTPSES
ncbi:Zn-ribbon domain-containing OB-fold protein [Granulicoccus phenolivorans]|uniref:Zn-ribbon domain-containing OB-fold protein n=1 Tax=Granulicoccus phenolivorans TaxID=266854 RepID=UPI00042421D1|nr:OB-fold domain-containing protein [Granulicoccus phenolivorans]